MVSRNEPAPVESPLWTRSFAGVCAFAVLVKLVLVAGDKRLALGAPFDELNFVNHARALLDGNWFGDYSNLTLIKGPFYPLFIALSAELGLPLRLAENLLYALACTAAVAALAPVMRSTASRSAAFVVLLFNPWTFDVNTSRVIRGDVVPSLALLVTALAVWIFLHRDGTTRKLIPASVALGLALSAFLLTREEGIWIFALLGLLALPTIAGARDRTAAAVRRRAAAPAVVAAVVVASYVAVSTANLLHYGWFTTVEVTSPEFTTAYGALARIVPPAAPGEAADPRIAVRQRALEAAYRVSPAARELEPHFTGQFGRKAARDSCDQLGVCGGISAGWFLWVFRDAVNAAGHYTSGIEARRYYVRLADEIDTACAKQLLQCAANPRSLAPRVPLAGIPRIAADAFGAAGAVVTFRSLAFGDYTLPPTAEVVPVFRSVTEDPLTTDPSPAGRSAELGVQREVGRLYQALVPFSTFVSAAVLAMRLRRSYKEKRFDAVSFIALSLIACSAALLVLLTVVNDYAFPALAPEYMKPLYAVLLFGIVVTVGADARYWLPAGRWSGPAETIARRATAASQAVRSTVRRPGVWWAAAAGIVLVAASQAFLLVARGGMAVPVQPRLAFQLDDAQIAALRAASTAGVVSLDSVLLESNGRWVPQNVRSLQVHKGAPLLLVGWAANPETMSQAGGLIAVVDGKQRIDVTAGYGGNRPDVAAVYHQPAMRHTGFSVSVPTARLSAGAHSVRLGVVADDRLRFYPSRSVSFVVK